MLGQYGTVLVLGAGDLLQQLSAGLLNLRGWVARRGLSPALQPPDGEGGKSNDGDAGDSHCDHLAGTQHSEHVSLLVLPEG
ncbi:hypothetical protein [Streptomyces vinaceus]|uniref:hypothetical protein n=1 Tax=Streptomyces vinaceus TaxID=1960 RepID=UPI00382C9B17